MERKTFPPTALIGKRRVFARRSPMHFYARGFGFDCRSLRPLPGRKKKHPPPEGAAGGDRGFYPFFMQRIMPSNRCGSFESEKERFSAKHCCFGFWFLSTLIGKHVRDVVEWRHK